MRKSFSIFLPGDPPRQTHQSRLRAFRIGKFCRIVKAKPDTRTALVQKAIHDHLSSEGHSPLDPLFPSGPVQCHILWFFPKSKYKVNRAGKAWRAQRPDLDNLAKNILDALTDSGAWADDSQVASLVLSKFNCDTPRIEIHLNDLPDAQ